MMKFGSADDNASTAKAAVECAFARNDACCCRDAATGAAFIGGCVVGMDQWPGAVVGAALNGGTGPVPPQADIGSEGGGAFTGTGPGGTQAWGQVSRLLFSPVISDM